jgi:anti-anti-sigma factor
MQITATPYDDLLELRVAGRLDAEWAVTLQTAIDNAIRQGYHAVVLDLSEIEYVSSAGLSVLVHAHKQLQEIRGFFGVGGVRGAAEEIIRLTGLAKLLLCDLDQIRRARGRARSTISLPSRVASSERADLEIYDLDPTARMTCRAVGDPAKFDRGVYTADDAVPLTVTENTFALGHGAFGSDFAETGRQFGELLAVAGAVAVQPTGGASRPDYQVLQGDSSFRKRDSCPGCARRGRRRGCCDSMLMTANVRSH